MGWKGEGASGWQWVGDGAQWCTREAKGGVGAVTVAWPQTWTAGAEGLTVKVVLLNGVED
jgi:hypothetical protein